MVCFPSKQMHREHMETPKKMTSWRTSLAKKDAPKHIMEKLYETMLVFSTKTDRSKLW